jgi:hypothetical protein
MDETLKILTGMAEELDAKVKDARPKRLSQGDDPAATQAQRLNKTARHQAWLDAALWRARSHPVYGMLGLFGHQLPFSYLREVALGEVELDDVYQAIPPVLNLLRTRIEWAEELLAEEAHQ